MAIFHLSIKIVTRGAGKSAVGAAAYRSGDVLKSEYDGRTFDYPRKSRVVYNEIMLPEFAPREFADRSVLWNAVEKIEKAKNAQLARDIELALPVELSREQNISILCRYVQEQFVDKGMCADVCVHDSGDGNPHAHLLLTMRPFNEDGTWGDKFRKEYDFDANGDKIYDRKTRRYKSRAASTIDWNDRTKAEEWRSAWADAVNAELEKHGYEERIDNRSFARQGKDELPTVHLGVAVMQMERRGIRTERGDINRQVNDYNRKLRQINARIRKAADWLDENRGRVPTKLRDILTGCLENDGMTHWGKIRNLQLAAKALVFVQQNKISDVDEIIIKLNEMKRHNNELAETGRANERRLQTLTEHLLHSENYKKFRKHKTKSDALHAKVRELQAAENIFTKGKTQKALDEADAYDFRYLNELQDYEAAAEYLKKHLNGHKFTDELVADWKREHAEKSEIKKGLLVQLNVIKGEIGSVEAIRKFCEQLIKYDAQPQLAQQEQEIQQPQRTKSKSYGMEI